MAETIKAAKVPERTKTLHVLIRALEHLLDTRDIRRAELCEAARLAAEQRDKHERDCVEAPAKIEAARRELELLTKNSDLLRQVRVLRKSIEAVERAEHIADIRTQGRADKASRDAARIAAQADAVRAEVQPPSPAPPAQVN